MSGRQVPGIVVGLLEGSDKSIEAEATALAAALTDIGLRPITGAMPADTTFPMPATGPPPTGKIAPIRMLIGTKQ